MRSVTAGARGGYPPRSDTGWVGGKNYVRYRRRRARWTHLIAPGGFHDDALPGTGTGESGVYPFLALVDSPGVPRRAHRDIHPFLRHVDPYEHPSVDGFSFGPSLQTGSVAQDCSGSMMGRGGATTLAYGHKPRMRRSPRQRRVRAAGRRRWAAVDRLLSETTVNVALRIGAPRIRRSRAGVRFRRSREGGNLASLPEIPSPSGRGLG